MNINLHRSAYIFFLSVLFISVASITKAQEMNDEFKKKLRQSLLNSEMQHSQQMHQPGQINFQQSKEVLKVSPTTKLPTRLDRFIDTKKMNVREFDVDLGVTNAERLSITPARSGGSDFDPVRAIQRHKASKRKVKVDRIVRAYQLE